MSKTILVTGATDGIGLETSRKLVQLGHHVILHGRTPAKVDRVKNELSKVGSVSGYVCDLSDLTSVSAFAEQLLADNQPIDVLINNAGILNSPEPITQQGLDVRFVVNTIAPYYLSKKILPLIGQSGRIINLSSAAQSTVNLNLLTGSAQGSDDMSAYAQSKLAITMWSRSLAESLGNNAPVIVAVNPGSLLASKMVKEGFGLPGKDLNIGVDILVRAALSDDFSSASGKYFDNDSGDFTDPHPDALSKEKTTKVINTIDEILARTT